MKSKLRSTRAYGLFVHNEYQQPMSEAHIARLQESIREHGFLPSKPLTVVEGPENKYTIVDGHHRLEAATRENAEIYFVVEEGNAQAALGDINVVVRKWGSASLARMYADQGNKHYQELQGYVERGFPLTRVASLLIGHCASSGNATKALRSGDFKVKTRSVIDKIVAVIERTKTACPEVESKTFIDAISALLFVPEFDAEVFVKRALNNPRMVVKCATRDQMLDVIDEIYNFRSHDKCPLKHLAEEKLRERRDLSNSRLRTLSSADVAAA